MAMMKVFVLLSTSVLSYACTSDIDCSLNGLCTNSACVCDKPWSGDSCEILNFKPVTFPQGYGMSPNTTSWGGGAIFEEKTGLYHSYISRMTNDCPLNTWTHNSRIDHGVSKTITGPYEFVDVAIPTWSHNAAPIVLPDGTYAIVHIGTGGGSPNGGKNCTKNIENSLNLNLMELALDLHSPQDGSSIHIASSLEGPWKPLSPNTLGGCNNPAPWVHPNGTIYCVCGGSLKRATNIRGPWTTVTTFSHAGGPKGNYEDPYLFTDKRGHFHLFYHVWDGEPPASDCANSTVSAHAFSKDGFQWQSHPTQPYTTQVSLSNGQTITVATRERPKLFFDKYGSPTHLFNGVCSAAACPSDGQKNWCAACKNNYWDYTLVCPLDV